MAKRKRRRKNHTSASASTTATPSSQVNSGTNIKIPDPTGGYLNYEPDTAPTGQTDTESRLTRDHKKDEEDPYDKIRMADIWAEDEITRKKKVEQPSSSENPYLYRDENFEEDLNRQGYESTSSVGSSNLSGIDYTREEEERAEETRRRNLEAQEAELNNGRSSMDEQTVEAQWRQARGFLTDQSEQKLRDSVFAFPSHEHTSTSGETEEKKVDFAPDPKQQNYSATGSAEFNSALGASSVSASENGNYQSQQFISQADWGSHTHPAEEHVPQYGAENSNTIYQTQESAPVNDGNMLICGPEILIQSEKLPFPVDRVILEVDIQLNNGRFTHSCNDDKVIVMLQDEKRQYRFTKDSNAEVEGVLKYQDRFLSYNTSSKSITYKINSSKYTFHNDGMDAALTGPNDFSIVIDEDSIVLFSLNQTVPYLLPAEKLEAFLQGVSIQELVLRPLSQEEGEQ